MKKRTVENYQRTARRHFLDAVRSGVPKKDIVRCAIKLLDEQNFNKLINDLTRGRKPEVTINQRTNQAICFFANGGIAQLAAKNPEWSRIPPTTRWPHGAATTLINWWLRPRGVPDYNLSSDAYRRRFERLRRAGRIREPVTYPLQVLSAKVKTDGDLEIRGVKTDKT